MALHNFSAPYGPSPGLGGFGGYYPPPSPSLYHPPAPPPPPPRTFQPPPLPASVPGSTQRPFQQQQQSLPRQQQQHQQQQHVSGPTTPRYTRVNSGSGSKTSVHAIIDYDDDFSDQDYYDDIADPRQHGPTVTPIQGPILIKNGSVPVVPLYSYPTVNNGSLVQIPILWTALSLALGLEVRGDVIRGVPCVKRFHQLYCPTAGNSYPIDKIESFIDENKALMKRMYGQFEMPAAKYGPYEPAREYGPPGGVERAKRRTAKLNQRLSDGPLPSPGSDSSGDSYFGKFRQPRQTFPNTNQSSDSGRVDACQSKVEVVTPYWASNSAGKIRAIVNTKHFEQAVHQEVCDKTTTSRCSSDCGCEQKYKWHRLLAYDPDNDCMGIFMDWFLFPSCCVCRCSVNSGFNG